MLSEENSNSSVVAEIRDEKKKREEDGETASGPTETKHV